MPIRGIRINGRMVAVTIQFAQEAECVEILRRSSMSLKRKDHSNRGHNPCRL